MKITINGKQEEISDGLSVLGLLAEKNVQMPEMVSVERNGEILSRDTFGATLIAENDTIEFLYFMGGGTW